ncbi:hypothetical protein DFH28DRAFT_1222585 [Melampsora americana]|nr:hypothetical protein DFH28DRAFT_1222585 [Melampsora americana]
MEENESKSSHLDTSEHDDHDGSNVEDEEEEREEEGPLFKYRRLEGEVDRVFGKDSGCAIVASGFREAIGTHNEVVHILNHETEIIKRFRPHSATIHEIKIEASNELFRETNEILSRTNVSQTSEQTSFCFCWSFWILHEKCWLGDKEPILHSGECPIWSTDQISNLVVWANDTSSTTIVEVLETFPVDCIISRLCSWGQDGDLAVLAYIIQDDQHLSDDGSINQGESEDRYHSSNRRP